MSSVVQGPIEPDIEKALFCGRSLPLFAMLIERAETKQYGER